MIFDQGKAIAGGTVGKASLLVGLAMLGTPIFVSVALAQKIGVMVHNLPKEER